MPERISRALAWTIPFGLALYRCSPFAQWRGDFAALRDVALLPMGYGGGVSTALAQIAQVLPVGSKTFRTALLAAFAIAVAGACLHAIALRMLRTLEGEEGRSRWAAPLLATLASLTATMTPLFQEESTLGGGAVVGVALALAALAATVSAVTGVGAERPMGRLVGGALLAGCAVAERPGVGAAALVSIVAGLTALRFFGGPKRVIVPWRVVTKMTAAAVFGGAVASIPSLVRGIAPRAEIALGGPWRAAPPDLTDLSSKPRLLEAFVDEVGWIPLGLAAFGAVLLVSRCGGRALVAAPLAVVAFDVVSRAALGTTPGTVGVRLLAIGCLACASTAGLFAGAGLLVRMRVPMARASAALLVAFHATLVALVAEMATDRADRGAQQGADEFTDFALDALPPAAAIVAGNPHTTWRLTAARILEGRRPDVLLVPRSLVARGRVAVDLLARDRVAEPLLRSFALTGASDEVGLATIADERPLFLEIERGWTERVTSHLTLEGAWLRFRTDPPSRTDRDAALVRTLRDLRDRFPAGSLEGLDADTRFVLGGAVRAHAKVLLKQGDADGAGRCLAELGGTRPIDALAEGGSYDVIFASAVARLPIVRHMHERNKPGDRAKADAAAGRKR